MTRPYEQVMETARIGSPFSTGTEWDAWSSVWCETCIHYDDCPLIMAALMNCTPREWHEIDKFSLYLRYSCSDYVEVSG